MWGLGFDGHLCLLRDFNSGFQLPRLRATDLVALWNHKGNIPHLSYGNRYGFSRRFMFQPVYRTLTFFGSGAAV